MTSALAPTLRQLQGKVISEQATGCAQRGRYLGRLYLKNGYGVAPIEAQRLIREGDPIEYPNAGAGSYREVFEQLGFKKIETIETCSSAGDWSLAVQDKDGTWREAWQTNRYPYHGFSYTVGRRAFPTIDDVITYFQNQS